MKELEEKGFQVTTEEIGVNSFKVIAKKQGYYFVRTGKNEYQCKKSLYYDIVKTYNL